MKKSISLIFVLISFFAVSQLYAADNYTLVDLGTIGKDWSYATSINNNGIVVGATGSFAPFRLFGAKWETMPKSDLPLPPIAISSANILPSDDISGIVYAKSINDLNEIVGTAWKGIGNHESTAVIWEGEGPSSMVAPFSIAQDINNFSQVLGNHDSDSTYLWEPENYREIIPMGSYGIEWSRPSAINDLNMVVGQASINTGDYEYYTFAYLWKDKLFFDLNKDMNLRSKWHLHEATDINNYGQIIGDCGIDGGDSSFLISVLNVIDLGFVGAKAINENGQIVGGHFLYEVSQKYIGGRVDTLKNGKLYNLNKLIKTEIAYKNLRVIDINNSGQIVGRAIIGKTEHAVLLSPTK